MQAFKVFVQTTPEKIDTFTCVAPDKEAAVKEIANSLWTDCKVWAQPLGKIYENA